MSAESPDARVEPVASSTTPSTTRRLVGVPVIAALLAVALLCGVGWVAAIEATSSVQSAAQERVRSNHNAAVRALVRQADDLKSSVATWAANTPVIDSLDTPTTASLRAVQDQLSTLARSESSPGVFVTDLRGLIVASYPAQPGLIGGDFSYRDWFKGAARTGGPYVSEAYRTAVTGHPLVVGVSAPVSRGARRVGYITVLWQLNSVRALSEGSRVDDGLTITVTDQAGQPLTGALSVDIRGQALPPSISETTRQALEGHSVSLVRDGMLVAAGPVPGIGWTVTAELPSSLALAPARSFQQILAITVGVALLLVLVFALLAWGAARRRTAAQAGAQYARSLIEAGLDPLLTISPEGEITDVNEATLRVTGIPREELVGTDFSGHFTEPDKADEGYRRVFAEGSVTDYPLTMRHLDGTLTEVLINASVYRDVGGKVLGVLAAARDVTEQKQAEAALAQQTKELDRLAELERFQRLTIGRELKMIELKKEIERLKQASVQPGAPGSEH